LFIQPDTAIKTNRNGSRSRIISEVTLSPPLGCRHADLSSNLCQIEFSDTTGQTCCATNSSMRPGLISTRSRPVFPVGSATLALPGP
jgi:hypothetical protein